MIESEVNMNGNLETTTNLTGVLNVGSGGSPTDVQINGNSITSNNVANILTEGEYSAENKIVTKGYVDNILGNIETLLGGI